MDDATRFKQLASLPGVVASTSRTGRTYTLMLRLNGQLIAVRTQVATRGVVHKAFYVFLNVTRAEK